MAQVIQPHFYQSCLLLDPSRFKVAVWGRRSGKSTGARFKVYDKATRFPGSKIWCVALTFSQAKMLYWDALVGDGNPDRLIPDAFIETKRVSELYIKLINGSQIWLKGSDRIDSQLGESLDLLILDEFQSQSMDVWNKIRPMLSDRKGEALIIGTPRGYNHLYDLYWRGCADNPDKMADWKSWTITSLDAAREGTGLDMAEIYSAQEDMSLDQYNQEYMASFDAVSGRVFKPFDLKENVTEEPFVKNATTWSKLPIRVGMDFNVDPMTACLAVIPDRRTLYIFDEIYLNNSNTPEMVEHIRKVKGNRHVIVYPDASGSQRSSQGLGTNHSILQKAGFTLRVDASNPPIEDRINEVNALLCNALGERRLFIHPRCKNVIRTLHSLTYDDQGKPDKKSGFDHMADAVGYLVHQEFPIVGKARPTSGHF